MHTLSKGIPNNVAAKSRQTAALNVSLKGAEKFFICNILIYSEAFLKLYKY